MNPLYPYFSWAVSGLLALGFLLEPTSGLAIQIQVFKPESIKGDPEIVQLLQENQFDRLIELSTGRLAKDPNDVEAIMLLSLGHLGRGDDEQALRQAEVSRSIDPERSMEIYGALARFYFAKGRMYRALFCAQTALEVNPDPALHQLVAEIYLAQGRLAKARGLLEEGSSLTTDYLNLARIYLLQGEHDRAVAAADKISGDRQASIHASTLKGSSFLVTGQMDRARAEYEKLKEMMPGQALPEFSLALADMSQKRWSAAAQRLSALTAAQPKNQEAWAALAVTLHQEGQLNSAASAAELALQLDPDRHLAHWVLGCIALGANDFEKAERNFFAASPLFADFGRPEMSVRDLIGDGGEDLPRLMSLTSFLHGQGLHRTTVEILDQAPQRDLHPILAVAKARALSGMGDVPRAIQIYHTLSGKDLSLMTPLLDLAVLASREANWNEAVHRYQEAARLAPANPFFQLRLGDTYYASGDIDGAIASYQKAIALAPRLAVAHNQLAWTLAEKKRDYPQAAKAAEKARSLAPRDVNINDTLGFIYLSQGRVDEASAVYSNLWQTAIRNASIYFRMGLICRKTGEIEKSLVFFEKALDLTDEFPEAAQAISFLKTGH